jgi:hypothetical protein
MIDFNEFAENTGYEFGMMNWQALTERPHRLSLPEIQSWISSGGFGIK